MTPFVVRLRALGTTALVAVTHSEALAPARATLVTELRALDLACSRFRPDSELQALNRSAGRPMAVGELLWQALGASLEAARMTGGLVDPTVGNAMQLIGYDQTFSRVVLSEGRLAAARFAPAGRWQEIERDPHSRTVLVPTGVQLDLGAAAKAFAADRIAGQVSELTGAGTLVSLGGDIALGGPAPGGGWVVGVDDDHATPARNVGVRVAVTEGGLASSGIRVRRWRMAGTELHHIVNPRTGRPVRSAWSTVTVAASSCLDANAASTAAVVLGHAAPAWLANRRLPARLVRLDGAAVTVGGWPREEAAA